MVQRARTKTAWRRPAWAQLLALLAAVLAPPAAAEPVLPSHPDQVIEVLPAGRAADKQLRRALAARPGDARLAVMLARRLLEQAHATGDPRPAGQALSALAAWPQDADAPADVLLARANAQQYLHDFDGALLTLQHLVARADGARVAQAWLARATILRVQGRYAESDHACGQLRNAGAALYAGACLAENLGLRGQVRQARQEFTALLNDADVGAPARAWIYTSLAELEVRDGGRGAADAAFRQALGLSNDGYARIAYADFLVEQGRPREALAVLRDQPRSDAVLLRMAIAAKQAGLASAPAIASELRQRIALENLRPGAPLLHGREQAMFALSVDGAAATALGLARGNLAQQREAVDLLLMARAAAILSDKQALAQVRALKTKMGIHDQRLDALL